MKYVVIDVREPFEYADGHVDGALNIPPSTMMDGAKELDIVPKDAHIIVYCRTGSRLNVAMHMLSSRGFTNVINGINKNQVQAKYDL